jgi:hypothetical protein
MEIKNRKGVLTEKRGEFLKEMCWMFNNRNDLLCSVFELIKN